MLLADGDELDEKQVRRRARSSGPPVLPLQVKAAYRRWALRVHPDKQTAAESDADRRDLHTCQVFSTSFTVFDDVFAFD